MRGPPPGGAPRSRSITMRSTPLSRQKTTEARSEAERRQEMCLCFFCRGFLWGFRPSLGLPPHPSPKVPALGYRPGTFTALPERPSLSLRPPLVIMRNSVRSRRTVGAKPGSTSRGRAVSSRRGNRPGVEVFVRAPVRSGAEAAGSSQRESIFDVSKNNFVP